MSFKKYIEELKRRHVFKASLAYTLVAWLVVQVAAIVLPTFSAPDYFLKTLIFILILGFPINLIFSWMYDITPEGIQRTKSAGTNKLSSRIKSGKLNKIIIGSLVLVVLVLLFSQFNLTENSESKEIEAIAADTTSLDKSIAVIPFANESADEENTYFVNGMTEDIRNNLAKISDLIVRSKTSSEKYRVTMLSSKEIGEELGIGYLLEGTVQKIGSQVKIHAQLINTSNDDHIWQETYIRDISDVKNIFKVQSSIAQSIADQLSAAIKPEEEKLLASIPTKNMEAYDYYLKGNERYWGAWSNNMDLDIAMEAVRYYEKAIALDKDFSFAYTGLGRQYWWLAHYGDRAQEAESYFKSMKYLNESIQLDPNNGWAYAEMAVVLSNWNWDKEATEKNLEMAIKLMPNDRNAYLHYSYHAFRSGNCEKLPKLLKELTRTDPSMANHFLNLGLLFCQKKYSKIVSIVKEDRKSGKKRWRLKGSLVFSAFLEEREFDLLNKVFDNNDVIEEAPNDILFLRQKAMLAAKKGERTNALKYLDRMKKIRKSAYIPNIEFAAIYALLEDKEKMYFHLETGLEEHEVAIHNINFHAAFDDFKEEAQFQEIIRKMWIPYYPE
jgi:TolB-like protein